MAKSGLITLVILGLLVAVAPAAGAGRLPVDGGHASAGATAASREWFFAEGFTGPGFVQYLTILNPGPRPAHLVIAPVGSSPLVVTRTISGHDRLTVRTNSFPGLHPESGFVVRASDPVVVERATFFSASVGEAGLVDGGHSARGSTSPATRWLFAEGYTGNGFQQYLSVMNPSLTATAHVVITLGTVRIEREVEPWTRATLDVNAAIGPDREESAEVSSDLPIVVERPIYFGRTIGGAGAVDGGHVAAGTVAAGHEWWFAEGYTGEGFQGYLCLYNPSAGEVVARVVAHLDDGSTLVTSRAVAGRGRATLNLNEVVGPEREFAIHITAPGPFVAERPVYFRRSIAAAGLVDGGHLGVGATELSTTWHFAEGHAGGRFQEYLSVYNPSSAAATVPVLIVFPDGMPVAVTMSVPGSARSTLDVRVAAGQLRDVALVVGPASVPVAAERPVYFSTSVPGP